MLIGILADVHANLQALEAVLAWLDARRVDDLVCLGDVVGYGGDPERCVEIVRERCSVTVRGNHDHAVFDPGLRKDFNDHARRAVERHAEILGEAEVAWLRSLPAVLTREGLALGHAAFTDPEAYPYVTDSTIAAAELAAMPGRIGFIGHTHVPAIFRAVGEDQAEQAAPASWTQSSMRGSMEVSVRLEGPHRFLVNPGSVGQPRDRDPRAACAAFDPIAEILVLARIPYDVPAAQRAILDRRMPDFEASRLAYGM
ncbi:MAG TPA: metallophosphoesterase family protein [Gemmatimonadota bacterium]|nr:metallophosphoesterase family protein [Gemmatimonadota bacterium]